MSYKIGIIGTGYVGLVSGTCFAETGNNVVCVDIDEEKVKTLRAGKSPIFEPKLDYLLEKNIRGKRLEFTTSLEDAVKNTDIIFLCLPTPPNEDGSADLQHVMKVTTDIANIIKENNIEEKRILINKSTVPVGTAAKVRKVLDDIIPDKDVHIASNPEFLREGFAVDDALKPERVVVGTSNESVGKTLRDLYQPFVRSGNPIYIMDEKSAEVTKYAANSFLATKISFMNDLSAYCEKVGADIDNIRLGIGSDTRIGKRFLFAGVGYGGSCFPKDVRALMHSAADEGTPLRIIEAAHQVNDAQTLRFADTVINHYGGNISGKKFALWGLAFKPDTDDTREAPAFKLIEKFLAGGAKISAFDPEATENTKRKFGEAIEYSPDMYSCLEGADCLVIATEWNVFRNPDFKKLKNLLKENLIFDGRNLYELSEMEAQNFTYYSIGRRYLKV